MGPVYAPAMGRLLVPCSACRRHIARTETICPFCATEHEPGPRRARPALQPGMSRAARLALQITLGGTAAAGCAGKAPDAGAPSPVAEPERQPPPVAAISASAPAPSASAAPSPEPPRRGIPIYGSPVILILERVGFARGSTRLPAEADGTLAAVAEAMKARPHWHLVCSGRADASEGADQFLKTLARRRAEAVVTALVKKGVARDRLVPTAFGAEDPSAPSTPDDQQHNRAVTFRPQNADGSDATENPP